MFSLQERYDQINIELGILNDRHKELLEEAALAKEEGDLAEAQVISQQLNVVRGKKAALIQEQQQHSRYLDARLEKENLFFLTSVKLWPL